MADGSEHRRPQQIKPAPADPPLGRDGQAESPPPPPPPEPENGEEAASPAAAPSTPQGTPTHTLSRSPPRRRTEGALYGCTALLAAVALGLDLRELPRGAPGTEEPGPWEERKKREGVRQRAPWPRGAANRSHRASASLPTAPRVPGHHPLSRTSLSTKCLLQAEGGDSLEGDVPAAPVVCPATAGGCPPASPPGHTEAEAERGVWGHLGPPSEQTRGNAPPWASSKKTAAGHRRTVSDGNACLAPAAAAPGATALSPERMWGPLHPSWPQRNLPPQALPLETPPGKPRAFTSVPLTSILPAPTEAPQVFPGRTEPLPLPTDPGLGSGAPTPGVPLGAQDRTRSLGPSLLDTDLPGQSRDCTPPLCRVKRGSGRPSV